MKTSRSRSPSQSEARGGEKTVITGSNAGYPVVWISTPAVKIKTVSVTLEEFKIQHGWQAVLSGYANRVKNICGYGLLAQRRKSPAAKKQSDEGAMLFCRPSEFALLGILM